MKSFTIKDHPRDGEFIVGPTVVGSRTTYLVYNEVAPGQTVPLRAGHGHEEIFLVVGRQREAEPRRGGGAARGGAGGLPRGRPGRDGDGRGARSRCATSARAATSRVGITMLARRRPVFLTLRACRDTYFPSIMNHFHERDDELWCEGVNLRALAGECGTPLYVYSHATLERHFAAFDGAFAGVPHLTCYAVKANSNLAVLGLLAGWGAGMDVVSGGELFRALRAGTDPKKIVYAGVGKTAREIADALRAGILMFNVESVEELEQIDRTAGSLGLRAPVALRVNPAIDPLTHKYIATGLKESKFGIEAGRILETYRAALKLGHLDVVGIHCHIGSQITQVGPFREAVDKIADLVRQVRALGADLRYVDIGGGLGISYNQEEPPEPKQLLGRDSPGAQEARARRSSPSRGASSSATPARCSPA